MNKDTFIWTDLSCYDPKQSTEFYKGVFGWSFEETTGYFTGHNGHEAIAGIYETPDFFKKINMPHFWMNYIQVRDTSTCVHEAKKLGAIIEIENESFYGGQIALIRDPMGAGFTIYDGVQLRQSSTFSHGCVIGRELHVSDANMVIDFYGELFNWTFHMDHDHKVYKIQSQDGLEVGQMMELANSDKGKFEYWTTIFAVDSLEKTLNILRNLGGLVISDEGNRKLCTDHSGEAFFYIKEI